MVQIVVQRSGMHSSFFWRQKLVQLVLPLQRDAQIDLPCIHSHKCERQCDDHTWKLNVAVAETLARRLAWVSLPASAAAFTHLAAS